MNLKMRIQKKQKRKSRKIKFYHSFLTIVLIICVCEIGFSAFINLAKIIAYQAKIITAKELKNKAEERNRDLKNEIQNFSSMYKVESIARNNLKMAAKDEVLIIINESKEQQEKFQKAQSNKFFKFMEEFAANFSDDDSNDRITE